MARPIGRRSTHLGMRACRAPAGSGFSGRLGPEDGAFESQRHAVTKAIATRYKRADKVRQGTILDELCATTGWHRNHARKALGQASRPRIVRPRKPRPALCGAQNSSVCIGQQVVRRVALRARYVSVKVNSEGASYGPARGGPHEYRRTGFVLRVLWVTPRRWRSVLRYMRETSRRRSARVPAWGPDKPTVGTVTPWIAVPAGQGAWSACSSLGWSAMVGIGRKCCRRAWAARRRSRAGVIGCNSIQRCRGFFRSKRSRR